MKIGIIGCGYLGQKAARFWKQRGHFISAFTRCPEKILPLSQSVDRVFLDFSSFITNQELLLVSVAPDQQSDYRSTYLRTAERLLQHIAGSSVTHILYTSSTSIYGDYSGEWVDEETEPRSETKEGLILLETEKVLLSLASSLLPVAILRLGELHGPGRQIADRLRRLQGVALPGTGDSYVNLTDVDELTRGLEFARLHALSGLFNFCSPFHPTRKELYNSICQKEEIPPVVWDPSRISPHAGNKRVCCRKIEQLGFQ